MNGGIVIVTRGDEGAVVFDGVNRVEHAGFKVEVVDPVGAGDAFVAGFLGGVLEHHTLKEFVKLPDSSRRDVLQRSLEIANACGALTCTRRGDTAAMPTIDEVVRFIASQGANVASL
jgi:sugar/nucleoside kinase (ribokinase family)